MVCAAEPDLLDVHRREPMQAFVDSYRDAAGPPITLEQFELMYRLAVSVDAFLWMINAPSIVETHLPNFPEMADRFDQRLQTTFLARAQQQILTVMLNEFSNANVEDAIATLLEAQVDEVPAVSFFTDRFSAPAGHAR